VLSEKEKRLIRRNRARALRRDVLEKLGGECSVCGISDYRVLQIDHINGGGSQDRKNIGHNHTFLKIVLDDDGSKYQLLCANCNWIKRFENNENPKVRNM
jgi:hypothetical protein